MTSPNPWPKCCAPLCDKEADHSVHASGDNGEFDGMLCSDHEQMFCKVFPARFYQASYMRVITREMLDEAMKAQT